MPTATGHLRLRTRASNGTARTLYCLHPRPRARLAQPRPPETQHSTDSGGASGRSVLCRPAGEAKSRTTTHSKKNNATSRTPLVKEPARRARATQCAAPLARMLRSAPSVPQPQSAVHDAPGCTPELHGRPSQIINRCPAQLARWHP